MSHIENFTVFNGSTLEGRGPGEIAKQWIFSKIHNNAQRQMAWSPERLRDPWAAYFKFETDTYLQTFIIRFIV